MIAYSMKYIYWYMHLWLIWSTLCIVNVVIYYIWWSYIVFQQNHIGRHISGSIISNRNYSFHFLYTLYHLFINVHIFITDTITLLYHQQTVISSLSYFSHPCELSITSAGKFYCGFISNFENFILYLSKLIIFYSTFTYYKNVSQMWYSPTSFIIECMAIAI